MNEIRDILHEIEEVLIHINEIEVEEFAINLLNSKRVFLFGEGRSGYISRAFAMRLMHIGCNVYFIGDTTTPKINENDTVVIISGSGSSEQIKTILATAKNCKILTITASRKSPLEVNSDFSIMIPCSTKNNNHNIEVISRQPLSSLFDQSAHIVVDAIVLNMMKALDVNNDFMINNHY